MILDDTHRFNVEASSEKSFGIVFAVVFFIVAIYPLLNGGEVRHWANVIALFFLFLAYIAPRVLLLPNKLWLKFGMMLGAVVAPIVMGVVYFVTVVPTGLIMRSIGKDLLHRKMNKQAKTYWLDRDESIGSMKNQF